MGEMMEKPKNRHEKLEQKNIALRKLKELAELERDHLKERFDKLFQDYSALFYEIEELRRHNQELKNKINSMISDPHVDDDL
jgi:FtsZ-binding cell division protein ZapB